MNYHYGKLILTSQRLGEAHTVRSIMRGSECKKCQNSSKNLGSGDEMVHQGGRG